jgi:hypothetical protein
MNIDERRTVENLIKYCLLNFQIKGCSRMISSFIYQALKELGIDAPAVEGIVYVEINGRTRPFVHCFNVISCDIIDGSVYGFALLNKAVGDLFPLYVIGNPPDHMDYCITKEIKPASQYQFRKEFLASVISELDSLSGIRLERFDDLTDSRKQDLFYLL